jgi:hypothetical protein
MTFFFLQRFERKAATHHLENVNNLFANQQNGRSARIGLTAADFCTSFLHKKKGC